MAAGEGAVLLAQVRVITLLVSGEVVHADGLRGRGRDAAAAVRVLHGVRAAAGAADLHPAEGPARQQDLPLQAAGGGDGDGGPRPLRGHRRAGRQPRAQADHPRHVRCQQSGE